ncbi:MAG: alanine dehydrogenase, partial [Nitrospirales bacterium]|nr:alanine dehydrogenase [Nitrospirales bacterium]
KKEEYRVSVTPDGVGELGRLGHSILVETGAGVGSGFPDEEYNQAGAEIVDRERVFGDADLIVKVKEPLPSEYHLLRQGLTLFTYLHLAPNRDLTNFLIEKEITALGYETLEKDGTLPLLAPMSEIAGRMAPLMGGYFLQKFRGGRGVLPMGAVGVMPAKAVILGGGVVGTNAARVALGLGMETVVLNITPDRLQRIDELFLGRVKTLPLLDHHIREEIQGADMVIGAVLVPGGRTPLLITREMLRKMKKGAVIVDVSVDQGGCVETTRPTTHDAPVYEVEGIIHYAVANMPGAYPRTSTLALTNATLPYITELAGEGVENMRKKRTPLRTALNIYRGRIVLRPLAEALGLPWERQ